jgi:hypothetical protein
VQAAHRRLGGERLRELRLHLAVESRGEAHTLAERVRLAGERAVVDQITPTSASRTPALPLRRPRG